MDKLRDISLLSVVALIFFVNDCNANGGNTVLDFTHLRPPFTFRPSRNTKLGRCGLQGAGPQQKKKFTCYKNCIENQCCHVVIITSCEQSYAPTEGMDFVKEVIILILIVRSYWGHAHMHGLSDIAL